MLYQHRNSEIQVPIIFAEQQFIHATIIQLEDPKSVANLKCGVCGSVSR
jgi:hypothetical protein